jgi:outer membrane protein TolC
MQLKYKMKRLINVVAGAVLCMMAPAQQADTLNIETCLRIAASHSPLNRQISNAEAILSNKIKNLNTNWIPAAGLNAQATYNSETIDLPNMPSLPLDQYKVWADINQQIYDGGMGKAMKELERAGYQTNIQQTESEMLALRLQVSQVYFSLLLAQKNAEILNVSLGELTARKNVVQAGVNHGIILQENLLAMEAEEITLQQKVTELGLLRDQLLRVLSILMDTSISGSMIATEPVDPVTNESGSRPEFLLFDYQKETLLANQKLVSSGDMPKLFAFSQVAYGRPGYNMLSSDFHTFYTIGAGLKWNFLNYGDSKRQKKIFDIQKDLVEVKRENFSDQLEIQLQTEKTNIEKYDSLMKQDQRILNIRKSIASSSLSKLNNGVITSTDYLEDMNAEIVANLQYQNHKILKKQAAINYLLLQGKL